MEGASLIDRPRGIPLRQAIFTTHQTTKKRKAKKNMVDSTMPLPDDSAVTEDAAENSDGTEEKNG